MQFMFIFIGKSLTSSFNYRLLLYNEQKMVIFLLFEEQRLKNRTDGDSYRQMNNWNGNYKNLSFFRLLQQSIMFPIALEKKY